MTHEHDPTPADIILGAHKLCDALSTLVGTVGYLSKPDPEGLCLRRVKIAQLSLREAQDALSRAEITLGEGHGT